jgi:hypothetical protein
VISDMLKGLAYEIEQAEASLKLAESVGEQLRLRRMIAMKRLLSQLLDLWSDDKDLTNTLVLNDEVIKAELEAEAKWAELYPKENGHANMKLLAELYKAWQAGILNRVKFKVAV